MLKTMMAGALASGALLGGGAAQAHDFAYPYGYDQGVPPYAAGGYGGGYGGGYAPYQPSKFTLLGLRAGVTVLGVDVDGSAKLTVGASGWGGGRRHYAPPPAPPVYAQPQYEPQYAPQPQYVPAPSYGGYSYGPMSYGYSYGPCGC